MPISAPGTSERGLTLSPGSAAYGFTPPWRSAEHGFTPPWRSAEHGFTPLRRSAEHGFTPLRRFAEHGFTLVELLIVLTIIGLMSAAVVLAIPDSRGSLVSEAERFAARAHAAQERAIMDARPMAIRVTAAGYGFDRREGREWKPLNEEPFTDSAWSEGTSASVPAQSAQRVVFDSTGAAEPMKLLLARDDDQLLVEIGADGKARVAR